MTTQEMLKLAKEAKTSMMLADTDKKNAALLAMAEELIAGTDEILAENDPYGYWTHMFSEEYETYDWLQEHIEDLEKDGELTQEIADELLRLIDDRNDAHIIERCLEEGVL